MVDSKQALQPEETQDTQQNLPFMQPSFANFLLKDQKYWRKACKIFKLNYLLKGFQGTTPTHLHNPLTQLTTSKTYTWPILTQRIP